MNNMETYNIEWIIRKENVNFTKNKGNGYEKNIGNIRNDVGGNIYLK